MLKKFSKKLNEIIIFLLGWIKFTFAPFNFLLLEFVLKTFNQIWTVQVFLGFPGILLRTEPLDLDIIGYDTYKDTRSSGSSQDRTPKYRYIRILGVQVFLGFPGIPLRTEPLDIDI